MMARDRESCHRLVKSVVAMSREGSYSDSMTDVQDDSNERPELSDTLATITRQGKLMPSRRGGVLELQMGEDRVELLGPFDSTAELGDDVEVVGVPTPEPQTTDSVPGMLVSEVRRLESSSERAG